MNFNIYPAIDILNGKCVRLLQGDYNLESKYFDNPLDAALKWKTAGATWLHIVDLDGAKKGEPVNLKLIEEIIKKTGLKVQIGGGIRTETTAKAYLDIGAERVILGSAALKYPQLVEKLIKNYGQEAVVVSLDGRNDKASGEGWLEDSGKDLFNVAKDLSEKGVDTFIYTDIERDGTLSGPNFTNALKLSEVTGKNIIVAGGVSSEEDCLSLKKLSPKGIKGAITGRAIYTGNIDLEKLLQKIKENE